MGIGAKMPNETKVKDADGKTGVTQEFLKDFGQTGGYRVKWDADSTETQVARHKLDLASGAVTETAYQAALKLVVNRLGGFVTSEEKLWQGTGRGVLLKCRPSYLNPGEELHAHLDTRGRILRAHIKAGDSYPRVLVNNSVVTATTDDDKAWLANYRLRRNLIDSKVSYMDSKEPLPT